MKNLLLVGILLSVGAGLNAQGPDTTADGPQFVAAWAKVYIKPSDGFETYLAAAFISKQVPLTVVANRDKAEYELASVSESQKATWAKTIFRNQTGSDEQASITLTHIASGKLMFAYSVNKGNSVHGKQSAAEACAKHLKDDGAVEKVK